MRVTDQQENGADTVQAKPVAGPPADERRAGPPAPEPRDSRPEADEDLHLPGYGHGV
jgi:hypothetical protein